VTTEETRDLFRRPLEPDDLRGFDAVVIDPPRAGAEAQTAALPRAGVPVIADGVVQPRHLCPRCAALVSDGLSP
jgi:23S rRNA (uracil1939-C5)-methyltransferase